jgi:hypothetical protein
MGSKYISLLVEPRRDAARIEKAAASVIGELEPSADTFYERNQRALQRSAPTSRNGTGQRHADAGAGCADMAGVCAKVSPGDPARATCDSALKAGASSKA